MRRMIFPAVGVTVLACAGVALAAATQSGQAGPAGSGRQQTIKVFTSTVQSALVDLGAPGFSLGDQIIFTDNVLTRRNGAKLGIDGGVCSVVRVADAKSFSGTLQCVVTFSLRGSDITVQEFYSEAHAQLRGSHVAAITGGTGRFRAARGQATVTFLSNDAANVRFSITP